MIRRLFDLSQFTQDELNDLQDAINDEKVSRFGDNDVAFIDIITNAIQEANARGLSIEIETDDGEICVRPDSAIFNIGIF